MKSFSVIIQIKDNEHEYFPVVLFVMPYKGGEPILDAKYFHPTGSGANSQKPRPEPTLMSAHFPKPRGTLPAT